MKYIISILIFCFGISFQAVSAEENAPDSICVLAPETKTISPVRLDQKTVKSFTGNKEYDYYSFHPKDNFFERLLNKIRLWFFRSSYNKQSQTQFDITVWIIIAVVALVIFLLLYFFKPSLFYRSKRKKSDYQVEEETIHGINFEQLIRDTLKQQDYSNAVRWQYLYILKLLQDRGHISWDVNKTVNEYVREVKQKEMKSEFKALSSEFLYIRYGHFEATPADFEQVQQLSNQLKKRMGL